MVLRLVRDALRRHRLTTSTRLSRTTTVRRKARQAHGDCRWTFKLHPKFLRTAEDLTYLCERKYRAVCLWAIDSTRHRRPYLYDRMSYVGVPTVQRDSNLASSMITQDYISKRFRGEKPISRRHKPKGVDSCFGNFPRQYKQNDRWDGNPTLRRGSRISYTSPQRFPTEASERKGPDTREVSRTIRGVGAPRPATAGACRRPTNTHLATGIAVSGTGVGSGSACGIGGELQRMTVAAAKIDKDSRRPKSASASRPPHFREGNRPSADMGSLSGPRVGTWGKQHQQQPEQHQKEEAGRDGRGGGGAGASGTSLERSRRLARPRPKTAGATSTTSSLSQGRQKGGIREEADLPDREELEATRQYLLTQGKFRITPSKLMASLEVARATNSRPLSAPPCARRRRAPAPPKAGAWRRRTIAATLFRKYYVRGDLPISVDHCGHRNAIRWKIRPEELDFHVYLPIFFDGMREVEDPYRFLAVQGTLDMIESAPGKVLPVIPQLILPMKTALNTREPRIICPTLKILQQMILLSPMVGQALVPYYRQLLPVFNLFRGMNSNMGDAIDYNQRSRINVGELIMETLEVMEQFGGPDSFINIKYMIPTYESCSP